MMNLFKNYFSFKTRKVVKFILNLFLQIHIGSLKLQIIKFKCIKIKFFIMRMHFYFIILS